MARVICPGISRHITTDASLPGDRIPDWALSSLETDAQSSAFADSAFISTSMIFILISPFTCIYYPKNYRCLELKAEKDVHDSF